jgi:hypothetical protein
MDYVKIGGRTYDVLVTEIIESFNILYSENTGRTISPKAKMVLDPLGTFFGHKITFQRKQGKEAEYDRLFDYVSVPRYDGIPVEVVHGQTTISYDAYISNGERALRRIDVKSGKVYWDKFSVNIVPMEAQVLPE